MSEPRSPMRAAVEMQRTAFDQTMTAVERGVESQREFGEAVAELAGPEATEAGYAAVQEAFDTYVDLFTAFTPKEIAPMLEEFAVDADATPTGTAPMDADALAAAFETYSEELAATVEAGFEEFETQAETLERGLDELTAAAVEPTEGAGAAETAEDADTTADLETVSGIGPTYASRLAERGIESVADLAAADAATVAAAAEVAETRADEWVAAAETWA